MQETLTSNGVEADGPDQRRTALPSERRRAPAIATRPDGSVTVGSYGLAQEVLRSARTEQAGFNAALVRRLPLRNLSVLFGDGEAHRRQRSAAAAIFTPAAVATRHRALMVEISRSLVDELRRNRRAVLDEMSLALSAGVAASVVGLTDSLRPGLPSRLSRIFEMQSKYGRGALARLAYPARALLALAEMYLIDLRPAIRARRDRPRDDVISTLMRQGWSALDILVEAIAYGAAGVSTTREFIVAAAMHLFDDEELRRRFLDGDDETRLAVVTEILRLEPPVSTLYRRTTNDLCLGGVTVPAGRLLSVDLRGANADPSAVGVCPHALRPDRPAHGAAGWLAFGDGPHRCPGASVALHEAAVFLDQLFRVPGLRLVSPPWMSRNPTSTGYVLRGAVVEVD